MTTFDKREKAFEELYKHDQELQFKVVVRRNMLLGLWAAELLDIKGADAEAYAKEVVESDFEEVGDQDIMRKVLADFADKNVDMSEHRLEKKLDELMSVAKAQVMKE